VLENIKLFFLPQLFDVKIETFFQPSDNKITLVYDTKKVALLCQPDPDNGLCRNELATTH